MFNLFSGLFANGEVGFIISIVLRTSFIWLPILLLFIIWDLWLVYKRAQFFAAQTYVLLEIKVPREMFKSPLSMEIFLNGLCQTGGESNWYDVYWKGQVRPWFSLELAAIDGAIHFFIWTRAGLRNVIEANLYSQFPGIEIYEATDYTLPISYDPEKNSMWATEFDLTKPDPYPIKTYIDYGMDKDPKEEFKIDPMTPLIEFLGGVGREHQVWIQIILRAHKAETKDPKTGKMVDKRWALGAKEEMDKILKEAKGEKDKDGKYSATRFLTDIESQTIKALGRSVSKLGFDVGVRAICFAQKDVFNKGNIAGIIGGFRNYNSNELNGFKPARGVESNYTNTFLLWKERSKKKTDAEKRKLLDAFKRRAYFYRPFKKPYFVLNTEELATIYHFPGGVSTTPAFTHIGSKKSEAPSDLPV
jgi:hypothetical protein